MNESLATDLEFQLLLSVSIKWKLFLILKSLKILLHINHLKLLWKLNNQFLSIQKKTTSRWQQKMLNINNGNFFLNWISKYVTLNFESWQGTFLYLLIKRKFIPGAVNYRSHQMFGFLLIQNNFYTKFKF